MGNRVFVTLGYRAPVTELDARTGETLRVFADTEFTEEILWSEGVLIVRRRKAIPNYHPGMRTAWDVIMQREGPKSVTELPPASLGDEAILALDAETGKVLWTRPERRIVTLSMASEGERICYHDFEEIVCLDLRSGEPLWRAKSKPWPDVIGTAGTLVMHDGNDNEPVLEKRRLQSENAPLWSVRIAVRPLAMVQAAETLFIAGPPDTFPEDDPYAAFKGLRGGALLAFSAKGGKKLAEYELGDPPVFDGTAAGEEKLYISTQCGMLLCFAGEESRQKHELTER